MKVSNFYDNETEILTDSGWKKFQDLSIQDTIATLNSSNHKLEYQYPISIQSFHYIGEMYILKSRDIDLCISPYQKIYINPLNENKNDYSKWKFIEPKNIKIKFFRFKKDVDTIYKDTETYNIEKYKIPMDIWLEFLGYYISEGHSSNFEFKRKARTRIRKDTKTGKIYSSFEKERIQNTYQVSISQTKQQNLDKIYLCLSKLPFNFCKTNHGWSCNNRTLFKEVNILGKSYDKYLPNYTKFLSRRQSRILFEAMMLGDGSYSLSPTGMKVTYYTSSKKLADDVQELLLKSGYCGDISFTNRIGRKHQKSDGKWIISKNIEYRIGIKKINTKQLIKYKQQKIPYIGDVYSIIIPNHLIYTRRKGRACWSGDGFN